MQYFEGILQLRGPSEEVIEFARHAIDKREDVYISQEKKVAGGIDWYLSSQRFLRALGKKLKRRFNGDLKESRKLFSRNNQTSRDIYRVNVMFRLNKFKIGDIVEYKGQRVKVKSMGKMVSGVDLDTGKKVIIKS